MLLFFAAAAVATSAPQARPAVSAGASVQATATIRVISGVRLSLGTDQNGKDVPKARATFVHVGDARQPAKVIEFQ